MVIQFVCLYVCPSRIGTDPSLSEIENRRFYHMIAYRL